MRVIISGGGTGGHIYPAIAIADAILRKKPDAQILFVGAKGRMEMEKVPKAGYDIIGLTISGFQRSWSTRNLSFPFKLAWSLLRSVKIINQFKPDVVVGVGGYASGPILEIANRKSIPSLIQEQNSYPGITNKLLAKRVNKICVAYPGMERFFPKEKILFTGNPVRKDLVDIKEKKENAYEHFALNQNKKTILVFGGSLGARSLNEAMALAHLDIESSQGVQWIWQIGKAYFEEFKESKTSKLPNVHVLEFIDKMDYAYAIADVVICRAGALAISELCIAEKPAILIPSPIVSEDHQTKNAMALVENNAAVFIKDADANEMVTEALELLKDEKKMSELSKNIYQLAHQDADERIAYEIIKLAENTV